ncbi:MAG TPA: hypothetical protein VM534_04390, partial [Thermoanaerobaculia bacterium]|nr:hypothetical protein [Thermoanaerobaculia bacterium]
EKRKMYPNRITPGGSWHDDENWLIELFGKDFDDPWIEARARGDITNSIVANNGLTVADGVYHPFKYSGVAENMVAAGDAGFSNWFHGQTTTVIPDRDEVIFPSMVYQFWKDTSLAGAGTDGVYYLQWVVDDDFTDGRTTQSFKSWTNVDAGALRGFYFFDTRNSQDPQVAGGEVYLTPAVDITSADGNIYMMSGFIYVNAESFGTQGVRGPGGRFNFPGEPYIDAGYPLVDAATNDYVYNDPNDPTSGYVIDKATPNDQWDFQELDSPANGFDLYLEQRNIYKASAGNHVSTYWVPVLWYPGCSPGDNGEVGANCSEPHEPYLNLKYPADACCSGASNPVPFQVGWYDPAAVVRRVKSLLPDGTLPTLAVGDVCTDASQYAYCTSNDYDRDGYYDEWTGAGVAPILDGVLYIEGDMESQGNARYFGSVLVQGDIDNQGTNEVWFDERLIKNEWPPSDWPFPRVIITAIRTDE